MDFPEQGPWSSECGLFMESWVDLGGMGPDDGLDRKMEFVGLDRKMENVGKGSDPMDCVAYQDSSEPKDQVSPLLTDSELEALNWFGRSWDLRAKVVGAFERYLLASPDEYHQGYPSSARLLRVLDKLDLRRGLFNHPLMNLYDGELENSARYSAERFYDGELSRDEAKLYELWYSCDG
jgi:hypothetical protein